MDEADARRVLLLRAVESAPPGPLWTDEDRAWASRAARDASAERFVAERARHAFERLAPRERGFAAWVQRRWWRPPWLLVAALAGFVPGFFAPGLGAGQRIDLLSPPLHVLLAWNLVVYGLLLVAALRPATAGGGLRGWLGRALDGAFARRGPVPQAQRAWLEVSAPLQATRAASLLHLAAALFAAGMVAGLYWRGLFLDHRAAWESTFLAAPQVHAWLAALLAPAAAATGLPVPDAATVEALRVVRGAEPSGAPAVWIHLFAATLALFVVVPRLLLTLASIARARRLARTIVLPLHEPYFERLRRGHRAGPAAVTVLPHVVGASSQGAVTLAQALAAVHGDDAAVRFAEPVAFGAEETAAARVPAGTTLVLVLFDLAATPEREQQGRLLDALAGGPPRLALADGSAFGRRFANLPDRRAERRRAWQAFADAHGVAIVFADLDTGDPAALARAIEELPPR